MKRKKRRKLTKHLPLLLWIAAIGGAEVWFTRYVVPNIQSEDLQSIVAAETKPTDDRPLSQRVFLYKERKYVWIDNHWYYYNPDNIYMINGIATLFIHNRSKPYAEPLKGQDGQLVWDRTALHALNEMLKHNPFRVYTPDGLKTLVKATEEAKRETEKTDRDLEKTE